MAARFWAKFPARSRPRTRTERIAVPIIAALIAIIVWHLASLTLPDLILPGPFDVARRIIDQLASGIVWRYLWPTIIPALLGCLIAVAGSFMLGVMVSHSRVLAAIFEPFVAISQTVPLVAIAPLLVVWLGYGSVPIAVLCAIVAFFPMVTTTILGFRQLEQPELEAAMLDGATRFKRFWHIELPLAAPAIVAGMRAGSVLAMTGAIVGEFVMGGHGLGSLLTLSRQAADTAGVFTVIFWISSAAMLLYLGFAAMEAVIIKRVIGDEE